MPIKSMLLLAAAGTLLVACDKPASTDTATAPTATTETTTTETMTSETMPAPGDADMMKRDGTTVPAAETPATEEAGPSRSIDN